MLHHEKNPLMGTNHQKSHLQTAHTGDQDFNTIHEFGRGRGQLPTQSAGRPGCIVPGHVQGQVIATLCKFPSWRKEKNSIFYRKFLYLSVPEVSIAVNSSKLLAKCSHMRLSQRRHLADTLTTFSSQSAVVCQNSPRLINMDNATSHSLC